MSNRFNKQITDVSVLVIDETGANLGPVQTSVALQLAASKGLDLVEVAPGVCKIQDYQKFLYQQKKSNKSKPAPELKEFRFGLNIAQHDVEVKVKHINELLEKGHPIKLVIRFYGREKARPEKGTELLTDICSLLPTNATVDDAKLEGNQLITMVRKGK
jgi:translation initiation factor IF-3